MMILALQGIAWKTMPIGTGEDYSLKRRVGNLLPAGHLRRVMNYAPYGNIGQTRRVMNYAPYGNIGQPRRVMNYAPHGNIGQPQRVMNYAPYGSKSGFQEAVLCPLLVNAS